MKKIKIKKQRFSGIFFTMFALFLLVSMGNKQAYAVCVPDPVTGVCTENETTGECAEGFEKTGGVCFPTTTGLSEASITDILLNFSDWVMGIFSVVSIMAFVISGIQYLSSAGSDDMIKTAKRNLTWSIVGVLVGLSGLVIVNAVTGALSGSSSLY
jgi:hypothetical protein